MKKRTVAYIAATAAVSTLSILGTPSEAFADQNVNWRNAATGRCLQVNRLPEKTVKADFCYDYTQWFEAGVGQGTRDTYLMMVKNHPSMCLDSNARGSVYLGPCDRGNQNQWWSEWKTSTGWKLLNVATGRVLDSNFNGSVYTNFEEGDSNKYQRWT